MAAEQVNESESKSKQKKERVKDKNDQEYQMLCVCMCTSYVVNFLLLFIAKYFPKQAVSLCKLL